jgi:beta-lactamase regulating signal transducer with metallopeptidase domain
MQTMVPWIDAIGWTLLHFVWQGLLVGAGYAAMRALIPKHASEARHAAGLVALALLALAPTITLVALWPSADTAFGDVAATSPAAFASGLVRVGSGWNDVIAAALPWLVVAWVAGVCLSAARALRQWQRLDRVVRRWAESQPHIDAMVAAIMARFDFRHRVRALVSDRIDTPMLVGWFKPVILLPAAVVLGFPRQQIELILAHELGHLRRHDHLVNLVQTVIETVLFYHPVVHWISREVRNERELCCDHLVLRTMQGEPREYARTLAALEELRVASPLALAASGGELLERVRRIVGVASPHIIVEGRSSGRWLLVAGGIALAWMFAQRIDRVDPGAFVFATPAADWVQMQPSSAPSVVASIAPQKLAKWHAPNITVAPVEQAKVAAVPAAAEMVAERIVAPPAATAAPDPVVTAPVAVVAVSPSIATPVAKATPEPAVAETAHPAKPVPVRTVAPEFPGYARLERVNVDASFTIAADGTVRDIRLQGRADDAFKREAERALRQWRFDPASLPANHGLRYSQTFVFAPPVESSSHEGCVRQTGSMMCRQTVDEGIGATPE